MNGNREKITRSLPNASDDSPAERTEQNNEPAAKNAEIAKISRCFPRCALHYDFNLRDVPGIQETMAVIFWRLDTMTRDWTPVRGLARELLLPGVFHQLHQAMTYPRDSEEWILAGYVLDPLFDLGLIERKTRSQWPNVTEKDVIRVTALWRKFIGFAWNGSTR